MQNETKMSYTPTELTKMEKKKINYSKYWQGFGTMVGMQAGITLENV